MLEKFDTRRSKSTWEIITGDEILVYQSDLETKQQSSVWMFPGASPPIKFKRTRNTGENGDNISYGKYGHILLVPLQYRKTPAADW